MATKKTRDVDAAQRKKLARKRFRSLIYKVYFNRIWLDDAEEQKVSLNVTRNIAMMVRKHGKAGMLTLAEKTLINTHPSYRTVEDRKKLVTVISKLSCFSRIPPKVRARMIPVVKTMYLGPNRVVIKEGDPPTTVYFILTGEIEVTQNVFDPMKKTYVKIVNFISGPGDCIGNIELIENIPRRNTYITTNNVELLVFFFDDFNDILRPVMERMWMDKKRVLITLGYFDHFNEDQIIDACRLSEIREYDPLETIYYEDEGPLSYVHFIISGECMILQCLRMKISYKNGIKMFDLAEVKKKDNLTTKINLKDSLTKLKGKHENLTDRSTSKDGKKKIRDTNRSKESSANTTKNIEILCGIQTSSSIHSSDIEDNNYEEISEYGRTFDALSDDVYKTESESRGSRHISSGNGAHLTILNSLRHTKNPKIGYIKDMLSNKDNISTSSDEKISNLFKTLNPTEGVTDMFTLNDNEGNFENHFVDVGSLTFGGIFGLGEELKHRVIMARTTVQCLLLPRFWLFEKAQNIGNIWQRKRFYLDSTIPSRQSLYQNFLTTRKWQQFKNDIVQAQLDENSISNATKPQDIPLILHVLEEDED